MDDKKPQIIIYGASWCAYCHSEMQWLDKLGFSYIYKDIEADEAAYDELTEKSGEPNVPVTDIAGEIISGFDRPKIQNAIKAHGIEPDKKS